MALREVDRFRSARASLVCLALLASCSPSIPVPAIDVSVGAANVGVVRGSAVDVEVTLTRVGAADGPVLLELNGLPAGVTASFAPAVLTASVLTSTLTVTAEAGAAEDTSDLTVTATSGALGAEAFLTLEVLGPQPVTLAGTITNWDAVSPPFDAGALAGRDALARELTPFVTGQVDAAGYLTVTYAIPEGTWGAPLAHLFDDPDDPATCTDLVGVGLDQPALVIQALFHEVHGGAIIRYDVADDALDLMVYVDFPSTVTATDCPVLFADVAVDVVLTVGWNRLRLSFGDGTLLDGHDPDAVWIWD